MVFNSTEFLIFFPAVLLICFIIPKKVKKIWLLIASYYFYISWNIFYAFLVLFVTLLTYSLGIVMYHGGIAPNRKAEKALVSTGIIILLGLLGYYKYTGFLVETVNSLLSYLNISFTDMKWDIIWPIGISFYTFQAIGYLMDVYRGTVKAEKNLIKYALFISFFPKVMQGPIERPNDFLRQMDENSSIGRWDYRRVTNGFTLIIYGLFMKVVIADRIAVVADQVFDHYYMYGTVVLILGAIAFSIQIYCDFAGYSSIAIGSAKALGFDLAENFAAPYLSGSISEFWRNWHISLNKWLRDYLYIPLGGSRCGKWKHYRNILITFSVSGLWHGANWTYIFWGLLNGIYQVIEIMISPIMRKLHMICHTKKESFGYHLFKIAVTYILISLAWIFFRAENVSVAFDYIGRMLFRHDWWVLFDESIYMLGLDRREMNIVWFGILVVLAVDIIRKRKAMSIESFLEKQWFVFRWGVIGFMIIFTMIWGYYGPAFDSSSFIYFTF